MEDLKPQFKKVYYQLLNLVEKALDEHWKGATEEWAKKTKAELKETYKKIFEVDAKENDPK